MLNEEEIASTLEKFKGLEKLEILPGRVSFVYPMTQGNEHKEGLVGEECAL